MTWLHCNWAQYRRWLRYNAMFRPLALLPWSLSYRCADRIARFDSQQQVQSHYMLMHGMARVFPAAEQQQLSQWADNYFRLLARECLDVFCMPNVTPANSQPLVSLSPESLALLTQAKRSGRGLIIAMAHYSRLNLLLLALALAGQRLGMLTVTVDERNHELGAVERRYLNTKINNLMAFIGGTWVTLSDNLRHLYKALQNGETMVILFDAHVPGQEQHKIQLPFLGGQLTVATGIVRLVAKTGCAVVYGSVQERPQGWGVEATLQALPEQPKQILAAAVAYLEQQVLATPWQWWHWNVLDEIWQADGAVL